jgi:hypothetical protein
MLGRNGFLKFLLLWRALQVIVVGMSDIIPLTVNK